MKNIVRPFIVTLIGVAISFSLYAQEKNVLSTPDLFIETEINSGNPNCPFPQFLEYKTGRTLAKYNAEGVTHADMEKAMREAYQIMTHRCRYYGEHCGVKYITFNQTKLSDSSKDYPEVPSNWGHFCTEGDGYILLAAAIFADQKTYNGLYMWIHDNRMSNVKRFQDGKMLRPDYRYGKHIVGWENDETTPNGSGMNDGATDGDVDIAMAAYIAYKQWGDFMMQDGKVVKDSDGNPISLKEEAREAIKSLVDTFWVPYQEGLTYNPDGSRTGNGFSSGDVGFDGYVKGGCTWSEITQWTMNNGRDRWSWLTSVATKGIMQNHIDYNSVAYFNEFWKWLEDQSEEGGQGDEWEISQMKRAQASSEWLNEQAYKQGYYPSIGWVGMQTDGQPTFSAFTDGEDFRYTWRHMLHYMWHGETDLGWNPTTHEVTEPTGGADYNYLMAERMAELLMDPPGLDGNPHRGPLGAAPDAGQHQYKGIVHVNQCYDLNGIPLKPVTYTVNYVLGAAASTAVIMGDKYPDFLADMYRQCELKWDDASYMADFEDDSYRYENSTPSYFHGWFRTLGMVTASGNLLAPSEMYPRANVKVYMSVDKTYAYMDDKVDYTVQYRNYGKLAAKDIVITTPLDKDYQFVSATKGGVYDQATHTITWKFDEIPGFKSGELEKTIDSVSFSVLVADTVNSRVCLQSTINGSNFEDWVSNEYPNHATYTMERNCVDILKKRSLLVKKTANREKMNPRDVVKFTVEFENKSGGSDSWLNGGRKNVAISYGNYLPNGVDNEQDYVNTTFYQYYRFWHEAQEAYINMGNYRASYYMFDINKGFKSDDNPNGWIFQLNNGNDSKKYGYEPENGGTDIFYQKVPYGSDKNGSWNQRFVVKFPDVLTAASSHVFDRLDHEDLIHKGVKGPGLYRTELLTQPATNMKLKVEDDWSYSKSLQNVPHTVDMGTYKLETNPLDGQSDQLTPITPSFVEYYKYPDGVEVTNYDRFSSVPDLKGYDRVLVEEFDGYTWRRILGRGPLPGMEAYDVEITDTLPAELEWKGFVDSMGLGIKAEFISPEKSNTPSGVVYWTIPEMLVGEKDQLVYEAIARDLGCPDVEDTYFKNVAWISSKTDSPDSSQVDLMITCTELPPLFESQESLFKECSRQYVQEDDEVTYKLKFVNTEGSTIEGDMSNASDWIALGNGHLPKVNGSISCDQNNNQGIAPPYFFTNTKSYGKNVVLETTWNISNSSEFYFVFRYNSGTPFGSSFDGVALKMSKPQDATVLFELVDGTKTIVKEAHNAQLPCKDDGSYNPLELRFELIDDKLYIYANDMETPLKSYSGVITDKAGYVGVYSGTMGNQHTMKRFYVESDYAFDITLYDDVPTELEGITNISDNGKYDDATRRITWPTQATTKETALPFGDSIVVTFDATVDNCKKFINNYALATVYGRDTLKQLNTITCGKVCELTSAKMLTTECACDSALIQVKAEAEGSYYYTFYKKGETAPVLKNSKKNSLYVKEKGDYYAVVTNMSDEECSLNSDTVAVDFSVTPEGEDYLIGNICLGTKAEDNEVYAKAVADLKALQNQDVKVVWLNEFDEEVDMPNPDLLPAGAYNYTYKLTSPTCSCESDPYQFTFTKADTAALDLKDLTICSGQSGTLSVEEMVGYTYLWSDGSTDHELTTAQEGTYSVTVTTPENCVSRAKATITVSEELLVDLGKDTTICSADLPFILDATTNYDSYEWTDGSTASTFEVTETGDYEVKVKQGSCPGSGKISVTVNETPKVIGTSFTVTYLVSDTVAGGVFDKSITQYDPTVIEKNDLYTYVWYGTDGILPLSEEPTPVVPSEGNSEKIYYVKAVNGKCESPLQQIVVKVINSPMPSAEDVNYCLNDNATKPLEAEPTGEGDWDLTWYDVDGVTKLPAAPTPSTDEVGAKIYYVTQTDRSSGEESAKKNVTVTVHALPELATEYDKKQSCNVPILLNPLFSEKSGIENYYVRYFDTDDIDMYDSQSCIDCSGDVSATKSGTYTALAYYYPVSGLKCSAVDKTPIEIIIDKVDEVKIDAPETVCPFSTIELTASVTGEFSKVDYEWNGAAMSDEANVSLVDKFGKGKEYTFQLSYNAGACLGDTTIKVTVGRGSLTGALYANDKKTKEYRSCGDESVQLSTDHEGENFVWTTYDGDPVGTGRTVLVNPTTTTTYVVTFTNKCETSDTIVVGFSPFSLQPEVDQLNASICEGESAAGKLILNGYDPSVEGAYIKWFKDGVELPEYAGMEQLSIPTADKAKDAGVYTFEAHNGFCLATNLTGVTSATLQVKPYVSFSKTESVTAIYGSDAQLSMNDLNPTDATVAWKGEQHNGEGNSYIVTAVSADELFKVHIAADNYCERDTVLQLLVDAKVDVTASTEKSVICLNDDAVIVADTSNTKGTVRNPADYKINWYACEEGGDCQLLSSAVGLSITQQPTANTSYYVEVVYGEQIVSSEKIAVTVVQPLPYTKQEAVSCSGEEVEVKVTVEASSDYEVTWEDGTVGESITVAPEENTAYKFTITQNSICPISDQVEVKVKENPAITMGDEMIVCEGNGFKVEPKVTGDDIISYVWTDPNGTQVGEENALQVDSALNGQYMLKVKSESCGEAEASQKIQVSPLPILSVDSMSFTERVLSAEGNAPFEYKVDNGKWSIENSYTNLSYNMLHTAYARDVNGCVGILTFTMVQPPIAIPEYFTPDNGNVHDTWDVTTILQAYPNAEVTIYDRFGKVVAKLKGETSEWDGTYNGKPLPSTDYWYKLNVPEIDRVFTGHFTLLRGN